MSFSLAALWRGHAPTWIWISTVTLTGCVILNMSCRLHEPQFLHPESGHRKHSFIGSLYGFIYMANTNWHNDVLCSRPVYRPWCICVSYSTFNNAALWGVLPVPLSVRLPYWFQPFLLPFLHPPTFPALPSLPPSLYTGVTKINGGCYDCSLVLEVLENVMFLKSGIKMLQWILGITYLGEKDVFWDQRFCFEARSGKQFS